MENQSTTSTEEKNCPHCGANMKKFWHRITPGMINALIKARRHVTSSPLYSNDFHIYRDLTGENALTTVEQMNWTKLRFHGLVARVRKQGKIVQGRWLITRRGAEFLRGEIQIPKRVQTFRNRVVAKDSELITVKEIIGEQPYWDTKQDYLFEYASEEDLEKVVTAVKRPKKKKGQELCPNCGDILKSMVHAEPNEAGDAMRVWRWKQCPNCKYETEKK